MKASKYILTGAMIFTLSTTALAQEDAKATIASISQIIKANPTAAKDQVKDVFKKNKKNPEVLTGIARAYFEASDTANASSYANLAIKANKNYGPAYILLGDIEVIKDDGGAAAQWYQQATYFDPQNPDGYIKYASIYRGRSPQEAVKMLNKLREIRPDYPVDAAAARIMYSSNNFAEAVEYYDKVSDRNKLTDTDITNYATASWMLQKREQSLAMARFGLARNARKAAWNRLAFYNLTDLDQNDEALKYAEALFNASDSAKLSGFDYTYYGTALKNTKNYDKAIDMFQKALEENKDNATLQNSNRKELSDAYLAKGDYNNAIKYYEDYLANSEKKTASNIAGLATIYSDWASNLKGDEQKNTLKKADAIYAQLGEQFPENIDFANFMRARLNANLDPDTKEGLAKPFYQALADNIGIKSERDKADTSRLLEAYRYLAYYYLLQDNNTEAANYCNKILEIDPSNEIANTILDATKKTAKK